MARRSLLFFVNLSLVELLSLVTLVASATTALYLFSRARRALRVATLRFWQSAAQSHQQRRRRIDQPWSLLLQLIAIVALLLAIAQPRWGSQLFGGRDHVLLLDTSAVMASPELSRESRMLALRWVASLAPTDRVLLLRAGSQTVPGARFEASRTELMNAIRASAPTPGALSIEPALELARHSLELAGHTRGDIVYVGPARVDRVPEALQLPANFRYLPTAAPAANVGFTMAAVEPVAGEATHMQASFTVHNDGARARDVELRIAISNQAGGARRLTIAPHADATTIFDLHNAAGWIEARLTPGDTLSADDRVTLEIPPSHALRVAVYSNNADALRTVLSSDARLNVSYLAPGAYRADADTDLMVIDGFAPPATPTRPSLWIAPPANASPIAVRATTSAKLVRWRNDTAVGAGLRSHDVELGNALVFDLPQGAQSIADGERGSVAAIQLNRAAPLAVLGFHPMHTAMRASVEAPLLFANLLETLAPGALAERSTYATAPGVVQLTLPAGVDARALSVADHNAHVVPYTLDQRTLRLYTPRSGTVRLRAPGFERSYALSLPGYATNTWNIALNVARGIPPSRLPEGLPRELWRWFAALGLICIALDYWLYGRSRPLFATGHRLGAALKIACLIAGIVAYFEPGMSVNETRQSVSLLADVSDSMPGASLAQERGFANAANAARARNDLRVMSFAATVRSVARNANSIAKPTGADARATDIENAILQAATLADTARVGRLVLMSDGKETQGLAARAAQLASSLNLPIDTVLVKGRAESRLRLTASAPAEVYAGERFPLELAVETPEPAHATLELASDARTIAQTQAALIGGENRLRVHATLSEPGTYELDGILRAGALGEARFAQAVAVRAPRVLFVSGDAPNVNDHLLALLAKTQFSVDTRVPLLTARLSDYQLVVLNNVDLEALPATRKRDLEQYVQAGGGVLVIGGEHNTWVEKKDPRADPLDRMLPATVAQPRTPEGSAVVLIVDKSSSMEGKKMELARLAAAGVVENLRPVDQIGILIFDNTYQWAVQPRKADDKAFIKRMVSGIVADGGTQIAPALLEAYKRILPVQGVYKHIVLLTDGISEEGDSAAMAKDAREHRVTISTVGLGQDVNKQYLEKIAQLAGGKSYFLTEPAGLEQLLIKDVKEHTGSTTVEKNVYPRAPKPLETLAGIDLSKVPALKGYVRFDAKKAAEVALLVDEKDPLYTRWQYGLGRAAVFASDAKARWAADWLAWPGYDKLWTNLLRDLLPQSTRAEAHLTHEPATGRIVADYVFADNGTAPPEQAPKLYALGADGFRTALEVTRVSERHYRASFAVGTRRGLFRVRPLEDSPWFAEAAIYLPEAELTETGENEKLMRDIAAWTGGVYSPSAAQIFRAPERALARWLELWPLALALALALNFAELAWRRFRADGARWSKPRPAV